MRGTGVLMIMSWEMEHLDFTTLKKLRMTSFYSNVRTTLGCGTIFAINIAPTIMYVLLFFNAIDVGGTYSICI